MRLFSLFLLVTAALGLTAAEPTPAGPAETLSSTRGRVILNGLWRFQPAAGTTAEAPAGDSWGTKWVPGTWGGSGDRLGTIQDRGTGAAWDIPGKELGAGWYERTLPIPAEWAGRAVILDLRRVSTDARVWVDGKECGTVSWPYGEVDITKAVQPGQTAQVRILVIATPDKGDKINFMGYAQETKTASTLNSAGLIGEVFLLSRPRDARVSDVFVKPSTRKGELRVDAELTGLTANGPVTFTARVLDAAGAEAKSFTATVDAKAGGPQVLPLAWPWPDAKRWDLDQPNLYTLMLSAKGPGLADETSTTFGFREIWIEGRDILLNGIPLRLRPVLMDSSASQVQLMDAQFKGLRAQGFNITQIWPNNTYERGMAHSFDLYAERADALGMPMIHVAQSLNTFVMDDRFQPAWGQNRDRYRAIMEAEMRRLRNHPSILIWGTSGNLTNHQSDQNPRFLGQRAKMLTLDGLPDGVAEGLAMIKAADPTRPVFAHAGNRAGDIFTANHYLNFIPLQEREEWLSEYVRSGDVPYIAIEFGTPLNINFRRGRAGYGPSMNSEPLVTEFGAIYGGPAAYEQESAAYREALRASMIRPGEWGGHIWGQLINSEPAVQDLASLFIRNTWRSWRTAGLTGGMVPWDVLSHAWQVGPPKPVPMPEFTPGQRGAWKATARAAHVDVLDAKGGWQTMPSGKVLTEVNHEVVAWIAGPAQAFTRKDKSFVPGARLGKQVALINDRRSAQDFTATWTVTLAGKDIGSGTLTGSLPPGTTRLLPIETDLPPRISGTKVDGAIRLTATIGGTSLTDTFAFRVLAPAPAPTLARPVQVFDPLGKTTALLKELGVKSVPWKGQPGTDLLIIGREALSGQNELPGDLAAYAQGGGRVLIMTQAPDWLRSSLGLRVSRHASRRVFPQSANHPVLAGLDALDLRDWNGATTLTEPYPTEPNLRAIPSHGWKWGNQGVVASAAVEMPHRGGWRPLLTCEFDLAYSPLMELDVGNGRVTLCTLDLEDQAPVDPVARRLAAQLITQTASAPLSPRAARTVYLGGDAGARQLTSLTLRYERATTLDPTALNLLGADAPVDAGTLSSFVAQGGKVIVLARSDTGAGLGTTLVSTKNFAGSRQMPADPLFAGLGPSDLHLRTDIELPLCSGEGTLADGWFSLRRSGTGFSLATQLDPDRLDIGALPCLRLSRWRQTRALCQVLANAGASFHTDGRIFAPRVLSLPLALPTWKARMTVTLPAVADDQANARPDPGISPAALALVKPDADETGMTTLSIPCNYPGFDKATGEAVFRLAIDLPTTWAGQVLYLELGPIADCDQTFMNGVQVGGIDATRPNFNNIERRYRIPGALVKAGRNVIAVRVWDRAFGPGIYGRPGLLRLQVVPRLPPPPNFYRSDFVESFDFGDEPYRYYRW